MNLSKKITMEHIMNKTVKIITLFLFTTGTLIANELPESLKKNSVYITADGKYEADPDTALLQFNISAQEKTSENAYEHASRAAEQIRDLLKRNGINPKTAELSFFQLQPVYDYTNSKRRLIGYQANSHVSIKLTDFNKIAPLVQGFTDIDITGDQSVNYTLENIDQAKALAVKDGYKRALILADTIATAGEKSVDEMVYASIDTFENSPPRIAMFRKSAMMESAPAPTELFGTQKITITARVNVLFGLK